MILRKIRRIKCLSFYSTQYINWHKSNISRAHRFSHCMKYNTWNWTLWRGNTQKILENFPFVFHSMEIYTMSDNAMVFFFGKFPKFEGVIYSATFHWKMWTIMLLYKMIEQISISPNCVISTCLAGTSYVSKYANFISSNTKISNKHLISFVYSILCLKIWITVLSINMSSCCILISLMTRKWNISQSFL